MVENAEEENLDNGEVNGESDNGSADREDVREEVTEEAREDIREDICCLRKNVMSAGIVMSGYKVR